MTTPIHPSISLDGPWRLRHGPQTPDAPRDPAGLASSGWPQIAATVPGNVELDLQRAGLIPDPSFGTRIHDLRSLETHDWWYDRTFHVPAGHFDNAARIQLTFEGLDCIADCWVNGRHIARTENALVAHHLPLPPGILRAGPNEITLRLHSPLLHSRRYQPSPADYAGAVNFEGLHLRKPPHCWGWDILPRLPSAGIWRSVRIDFLPPTRWRDLYVATHSISPGHNRARLLVDWDFETDALDIDAFSIRLTLTRHGAVAAQTLCHAFSTHGRCFIDIENPDLWWPLGSGDPALYDFTAELLQDGTPRDTYTCQTGLRTVRLLRTELTNPEGDGQFLFEVNGEPLFIKGTNWVPLDALHSRDAATLPAVFPMLADLHCNMVRCWGGNVYEDHPFFTACDRAGILVWQDFAMGCAVYPQTPAFLDAIAAEAASVIRKLRNHPSLALWAGNNEGDEAHEWAATNLDPNTHDLITRQILPRAVSRLDPLRDYLPSSPCRGPAFLAQGPAHATAARAAKLLPEQHLWGPRDDFKGPTYTASSAHFASEIGYHGCPSRETLERIIPAAELWPPGSPSWLVHAVQPHPHHHAYDFRIDLMMRQTAVLFGTAPDTLDDLIFASQASQAEALKFFIEYFRLGKWRRTGILWWNLRDGWPVISDAVVDYFNTPKLAYHAIRRSQVPFAAFCAEPENNRHEIVLVNDRRHPVSGTLRVWHASTPATLWQGEISIGGNTRAPATTIPQPAEPAFILMQWQIQDPCHGAVTGWNHYLAGPRPFDLAWYRAMWQTAEKL